MRRWEYRVINPDSWALPEGENRRNRVQLEAQLNLLGSDGWELVGGSQLLIFKREIDDDFRHEVVDDGPGG